MGAADSRNRPVSSGVDQQDNVTVLRGVKLSRDVLRRMQESASVKQEDVKPEPETLDDTLKRLELIEDELNFQREPDTAGDDTDKHRTHGLLVDLNVRIRQLKRKEKEVKDLEDFYKEQLQRLENKNADYYEKNLHEFDQEASKAEATVQPRMTSSVCSALQSQVLSCYRQNTNQPLLCSKIAQEYTRCIHSNANKMQALNHG
ncbi:hypothetical protein DNTS_007608 [Danionella cerebrum]|uniref:CHCH domain-containing protein n=1 Tax=Danionella cerebrum TaxID=2873325 RepID=A0A553MZJ9_9TELE|nr:hypothetical protein DNTS_007608 [Danionella translucida]